ncbi:MAG: nucleotidyltransferase domain-containing protein [Phycisphaerae bacterium]|nr:nucleotidyltransferase domain-containing protein [Phycisphaerae bacterium]
MNREALLVHVKRAVHEVEPGAEVFLYGSRARKDCRAQSDWDFLILVEGAVSDERVDRIRHRLYEIEWDCDQVLCSVVRSREEWNSPRYKTMPFHQNVTADGILL